ncbi:MAG TPA: hypothetical protein VMR37_02315 [Rhabdochlamydiaceae bacterium]|nr:hypothetical protein [Rhabdochlamydiaceae bacterium]
MGIIGSVGPVLRNVAVNHAMALGFGVAGFVMARVAKIIFEKSLHDLKIASLSQAQPAVQLGAGFFGFQACMTMGRTIDIHRNPGFMPNPLILLLHGVVKMLANLTLRNNLKTYVGVSLGAFLSAGSITMSPIFIGAMGAALGASDIPASRFIGR